LNQEYAFYEDGSVQYFTDDHNRKKYYLNSDGSLRYGFVSNSNYDVINIEGQELVVDQADFYPNHSIKFLALHQYYMNPTINIASAKYQTTILGEKVVLKGSLSFHPNGQIKQFILDEEAHFVGEGYDIWAQIGELYSNGKINWLETSVSTNGMNSFVDREGADKPFNYHVQCGGFEHIYYWPNGNLKKIKSIGEDNFIHLFGNVLYLKNNTEIEFYENGFLKGAEFGNNTVNKITINDSDVVGVEKIELWDTGVIKEIIADSSHLQATMKVNFQGKLTRFFINHLSFYPTGEFHYGILDEWEKFDSANDSHYYADDTFIYADRSAILQGSVEEFWKLTNPERVSVLEMVKNF